MEKLLFGNLEFKPGINVTVRNGTKWLDKWKAWDGLRNIEIADVEGVVVAKGELVGAVSTNFYNIRQEWLDLEHASNCRTLEDLYVNGMVPVYPGFEFNNVVTVLFFIVEDYENGIPRFS